MKKVKPSPHVREQVTYQILYIDLRLSDKSSNTKSIKCKIFQLCQFILLFNILSSCTSTKLCSKDELGKSKTIIAQKGIMKDGT